MTSITIQGRKFFGTSPLMASAIRHFRGVIQRQGLTASMAAAKPGPIEVYKNFVAGEVAKGRTKAAAIRHFVISQPAAHKGMLAEYNRKHGREV